MMVFQAFILVYSENVSLGSNVRPSLMGNGFVMKLVSLIFRLSDFDYSAGSGMKRLHSVLHGFIMRSSLAAQVVIIFRQGCNFVCYFEV